MTTINTTVPSISVPAMNSVNMITDKVAPVYEEENKQILSISGLGIPKKLNNYKCSTTIQDLTNHNVYHGLLLSDSTNCNDTNKLYAQEWSNIVQTLKTKTFTITKDFSITSIALTLDNIDEYPLTKVTSSLNFSTLSNNFSKNIQDLVSINKKNEFYGTRSQDVKKYIGNKLYHYELTGEYYYYRTRLFVSGLLKLFLNPYFIKGITKDIIIKYTGLLETYIENDIPKIFSSIKRCSLLLMPKLNNTSKIISYCYYYKEEVGPKTESYLLMEFYMFIYHYLVIRDKLSKQGFDMEKLDGIVSLNTTRPIVEPIGVDMEVKNPIGTPVGEADRPLLENSVNVTRYDDNVKKNSIVEATLDRVNKADSEIIKTKVKVNEIENKMKNVDTNAKNIIDIKNAITLQNQKLEAASTKQEQELIKTQLTELMDELRASTVKEKEELNAIQNELNITKANLEGTGEDTEELKSQIEILKAELQATKDIIEEDEDSPLNFIEENFTALAIGGGAILFLIIALIIFLIFKK